MALIWMKAERREEGKGGGRLKVCKRQIGVPTLLWEELQKKKTETGEIERE